MERLWAPWRMEYIKKKDKNKHCILCYTPQKKKRPEKWHILGCSEHSFVVLNKYPYISGHVMVVPKRHTAKVENLSPEEGLDVHLLLQKTVKIFKKVMKPHGINIGLNLGKSSGAGLTQHLHYHVVPRWNGDTNFMPVIGKTRVVSNSLENTYKHLAPHFKR